MAQRRRCRPKRPTRAPETANDFRHDFTITFDVTRPLPNDAITTLVSAVRALRSAGVETIVAEGTLLGLFRDGELIPHDTDLDLYVIGTDEAAKTIECLTSLGWTVGQHSRIRCAASHITFFNEEHVLLDITFFEVVGTRLMSFKERDGYLAIDSKILLPPSVAPAWGDLRIPGRPEAYLEAYYGTGWRVPKSSKTFWKNEYCGIYFDGVHDIVQERERAIQQVMVQ